MRVFCSALIAATFIIVGCSGKKGATKPEATLCATEDGAALWTGECLGGLAHGFGTATFEDSYIAKINGRFDKGTPSGTVWVEFDSGGFYLGGR